MSETPNQWAGLPIAARIDAVFQALRRRDRPLYGPGSALAEHGATKEDVAEALIILAGLGDESAAAWINARPSSIAERKLLDEQGTRVFLDSLEVL